MPTCCGSTRGSGDGRRRRTPTPRRCPSATSAGAVGAYAAKAAGPARVTWCGPRHRGDLRELERGGPRRWTVSRRTSFAHVLSLRRTRPTWAAPERSQNAEANRTAEGHHELDHLRPARLHGSDPRRVLRCVRRSCPPASGSAAGPSTGAEAAKCSQPGCPGTVLDGYCDVCGSPAAQGSPTASASLATMPAGVAQTLSTVSRASNRLASTAPRLRTSERCRQQGHAAHRHVVDTASWRAARCGSDLDPPVAAGTPRRRS